MTASRAFLVVFSLAALAMAARSVLVAPFPLWFSAVALVGYAALVTAGVLCPSFEMFATVLSQGPENARGVALTFDDGPHPVHTRSVLDELDRAGAKATFFVVGEKAARHRDLVAEIVRRGHAVGVHGHVHDRLFSFRSLGRVRADLACAVRVATEATGQTPQLFRPPVGQTNPVIARAARELNLTIVGWSVRGRDGIRADPERVVARVVPKLRDGAIVLLHDAAERDDRIPAAVAALPRVLAALRERGLAAVRLDGWLGEDEGPRR
jgi:peptidoglycan/xylan/chitin deacetylase (PgdA/CDA1 family)